MDDSLNRHEKIPRHRPQDTSAFRFRRLLCCAVLRVLVAIACVSVTTSSAQSLVLLTNVQVTGEGVFLANLAQAESGLPHVRLCDAPAFGQVASLSRSEILGMLADKAPALASLTNWTGADRVRLSRRSRTWTESEVNEQLTAELQRDQVRDKGELELRFSRPWNPVVIPDEAYTLKVLDLPGSGLTSTFIARFEIVTPRERLGPWQMPVTAKVWREIIVARSPLRREQLLSDVDVARERRNVLTLREQPFDAGESTAVYEISESVMSGAPLTTRSVRLRHVVRRGQTADAELHDGTLIITVKVEVLEPGAPGQIVRVRNPNSKREFKGKVKDEQTILVSL